MFTPQERKTRIITVLTVKTWIKFGLQLNLPSLEPLTCLTHLVVQMLQGLFVCVVLP